ncbi:MAG: 1-acyl-sn-glycerol-3-phosphate acyltransferase [Gemmatimonadetes bacterium]|nr:1-acyl-sn-glycerol-3-phosphate acyltransferase [Gemmatimonadota bacterium]
MLRALIRLPLALLVSALLSPFALCAVLAGRLHARLGLHATGWIMHRWARLLCLCLGVRVRVEGDRPPRPAFLAPNHVSYLDIIVLGSLCEGFFVSRADVRDWPVLGPLARLGNTIFLERERRRDTHRAAGEVERVLGLGARIVVFLEGRAGPGDHVRPFKPSLLEAAARTGVPCVPVALHYRLPQAPEADTRQVIAWHDSSPFPSHAWRMARLGRIEATLRVLPERHGADRKTLAAALEADVATALADISDRV